MNKNSLLDVKSKKMYILEFKKPRLHKRDNYVFNAYDVFFEFTYARNEFIRESKLGNYHFRMLVLNSKYEIEQIWLYKENSCIEFYKKDKRYFKTTCYN